MLGLSCIFLDFFFLVYEFWGVLNNRIRDMIFKDLRRLILIFYIIYKLVF